MPSPWQSQYYDDLSDFDLKALASDIKQHRLRDPVEILPENGAGLPTNMVLDGCQRLAALRRNGETEVIVRVRHDLASADAATIEREFLTPNRNRRQLDPLAKARIELRLFELDKGRRQEKFFARDEAEASDRVA